MIVMRTPPALRSLALAVALALAASLLAACGGSGAADAGTSVVTSFYPLQYVAKRVVGDRADVTNLTQPGREPHDLELDFRQTAAVADADVLLYERGFQAAVDDAVDQSDPQHVVDAAQAAHLSGDDPHFWLDPTRLSQVAAAFEKQLAAADPAHRAAYARNLAGLQSDLAALDRDFRTGLAHCAISTIVVSHDAFGYLGRRYGLDVVGINGLSPDAEPSPAHIRQLQDLIRSDRITTVFSEELGSPKFADSLAGDLGIHAAVLDPIEGLSDATADQDYLSLMRSNLAALEKANTCS
jgi:zinc transport system substrate-binding protein